MFYIFKNQIIVKWEHDFTCNTLEEAKAEQNKRKKWWRDRETRIIQTTATMCVL